MKLFLALTEWARLQRDDNLICNQSNETEAHEKPLGTYLLHTFHISKKIPKLNLRLIIKWKIAIYPMPKHRSFNVVQCVHCSHFASIFFGAHFEYGLIGQFLIQHICIDPPGCCDDILILGTWFIFQMLFNFIISQLVLLTFCQFVV